MHHGSGIHPASAAEDEYQRALQQRNLYLRNAHLAGHAKLAAARRAKEVELCTPYMMAQAQEMEARREEARRAALEHPTFNDDPNRRHHSAPALWRGTGVGPSPSSLHQQRPSQSGALSTSSSQKGLSLPKLRRSATGGSALGAVDEADDEPEYLALSSPKVVRAVFDFVYDKVAADAKAAQSGNPRTPLVDVIRRYIQRAQGVHINKGLCGLRISLAECAPHPLVRLMQRILGWAERPRWESETQDVACWLLLAWLLPPREKMVRMHKAAVAEKAAKRGARIGGRSEEALPPRCTLPYEAVPKVLGALGRRKLFDAPEAIPLLMQASESLLELDGRGRAVIDVEEFIHYMMEVWGTWEFSFDKPLSVDGRLAPPVRVRKPESPPVGRRASIRRGSIDARPAGRAEAPRPRRASVIAAELDDTPAMRPGEGLDFAAGMRRNAMEFDAADADRDKKLDFDEFCAFVASRERGAHSAFELRSRFEALDADGSGKIDLHEFIRYSLRDALATSSARVMDLLREWDADGNGEIDRNEFHRALHELGFAELADQRDIDLVFDEFDTSGDGLISFKELNKMLRQAASITTVQGRAAANSEAEARRQRREKRRAVAKYQLEMGRGVIEQLRAIIKKDPASTLELFQDLDDNGDGLVQRAEFGLALRAMGITLAKKDVRVIFRSLDKDNSGAIEYNELKRLIEEDDAAIPG